MKKTILLSAMAATVLMAGGDIAPVEPAVVTPVEEVSAWDFSGQAVAYYETIDAFGEANIGDGATTAGNLGLQLGAVNKDIAYGIGAGAELTSVFSDDKFSQQSMINADGTNGNASAAVTQAYLTYGFGKTDIKVGRQELPKGLSPFAFSESWNVFKNTFEAAVIVNSDIKDTTLVGAYVSRANNFADLSDFNDLNEDGVYMLTAANTSFENLALTGTYYYAGDANVAGDANILWADAKYKMDNYKFGVQGGYIFGDAVEDVETGAFGAKVGTEYAGIKGCLSYSYVDDGAISIQNLAGGRSPLYTQMILNENFISSDADTVVAKGYYDALGGTFGLAYGYTFDNSDLNSDYQELDVTYSAKLTKNTEVYAGYIYSDIDTPLVDNGNNAVRLWGKYNF